MGKPFDKIVFESSPFLRTMSTSVPIAKALDVKKIDITYLASEIQMADNGYMTKNPIPGLEFTTRPLSELNEEFELNSIDFVDTNEYKAEALTWFPETIEPGAWNRVVRLVDQCEKRVKEQTEENVLQIVVSHGWIPNDFKWIIEGK